MKRLKKCIFTSLMGEYELKEPTIITKDWDYICYTNNKKLKSRNWDIRYIENNNYSNPRLARKVWILNHVYADGYDLSISAVAQLQVTGDLNRFVRRVLPQNDSVDMAISLHLVRNCIYEESRVVKAKKKDDPVIVNKQMSFYKKDGYPPNNGLVRCGLMVRKHGRQNLIDHCEKWWEQVKKFSFRDQLSFNYILWKYKLINVEYFNIRDVRGSGKFFKRYK
jgi:hypothetical protein